MEQEQSVWHTYSSFMKMVQHQAENVGMSKSPDASNQGDFSKHDNKGRQKTVMYACNQCDHLTMCKKSLDRHIQSKHEGVNYFCNQCDQQFTIQGSVTSHIRSVHYGVRYAYIKLHEDVKYPCNQCDYHGSKDALRMHLKLKHIVII